MSAERADLTAAVNAIQAEGQGIWCLEVVAREHIAEKLRAALARDVRAL